MALKTLEIEDGELKFEATTFPVLTGVDALAQSVENRIRLLLNEWFLSPGKGIDWLDILGGKPVLEAQIEEAVKNEILKEDKVLDITEFSIEFVNNTRELKIDFVLETTEGTLTGGTTI